MKVFTERPKEEANLLNPAFCCTVLLSAIESYTTTARKGMPFALIFMVLPILLHKKTRESLPATTTTSMPVWLHDNAIARVMFHERLISLKTYTTEAIWFGMRTNSLSVGEGAAFQTSLKKKDIDKALAKLTDDARECVLRARFLGKWFASAGSAINIMSFWGIRP